MSTPTWPGTLSLSAETIATALGLPNPTPQQREVIEAPPTPALVVAGAGSGKTETMSGRVVWLVANGHVQRDEVLGLTFTRKAAGELAERIMARLRRIDEFGRRGLLPHLTEIVASGALTANPDAERGAVLDRLARRYETGWNPQASALTGDELLRPRVATYNSFADAIVREHAARIGRDSDVTLLSQSGSWLLARAVVLRSLDERLAESDSALSTIIDAVQNLAAESLDNRADLADVAAYGADFARSLEPYVKPDLATASDVEKAWAAGTGLGVIADLARDYARAKAEQSVLDFADQVAGALEIVTASPAVAADLRAQYRVVLLDEYQDTSVLQTQLLAAVFRDHPVMAVGDPHQSIYGWRGASADNLEAFAPAFATDGVSARYELMVSWRNDVRVLTAANALLQPLRVPGRIDVGELRPRPGAGEGAVRLAWENTIDEEAEAVAAWFAEVRAAHDTASDGEHAGAILFRAKRHMQLFADALDRRGIPHRILGLGGLLSTPEVTDVTSALRVIHDPGAGSALIRLLTGPRFAIGVADLAALHRLATVLSQRDAHGAKFSDELLERLRGSAGIDEQLSIIDALDVMRTLRAESVLLSGFTEVGRARLRDAAQMFDRLRRASGQPIPELIRLIEAELRLDIELAANEHRGPARVAATQLRAFLDEVRAFLAADERGTIGSLLAWLSHAEDTDELMPRPEPPQPGVVQLLTIHGSKGLEWDAVAVVRLVAEELPKSPRTSLGWLSLGALPFDFRGDRAALPELELPGPGANRTAVLKSIKAFKDANKAYQEEEERRLAYVAVTRARSDLLLSGSPWGGQTRARKPSPYLLEMLHALSLETPDSDVDGENPIEREGRVLAWPLDALGSRRAVVETAAELARVTPAAAPSNELERLLAEREARTRRTRPVAPTRIPASSFKDYVTDFARAAGDISRPMPERPYPQTRIGTDFHAWVENLYQVAGAGSSLDDTLWELDDDRPATTEAEAAHDDLLQELQSAFLASEWAGLKPLEVESEVDYVLRPTDGSPAHIMICKLDAVFRRVDRGDRIEIVDWKTGRPPATAAEREERLMQLAHYRVAYSHARGIPLEDIDVALFYVAHGHVLRPEHVRTEAELAEAWTAAKNRDSAPSPS
ncbi:ATP-dependent DNA helicase [Microbacterium gorillae]|uniref:ATP-dependent DNA helicase n=1 Tax=Microbacterium gorillae TaxID=1231063 RepID=UPI000590CC5E|nr:ATP-dependent DNA helicase [Microbacterium gorillae]